MTDMNEVDRKIARAARAINTQINLLAKVEAMKIKNVWITEDGEVLEIRNHADLVNAVDDNKKKLDDMLRTLDELLKERDGV